MGSCTLPTSGSPLPAPAASRPLHQCFLSGDTRRCRRRPAQAQGRTRSPSTRPASTWCAQTRRGWRPTSSTSGTRRFSATTPWTSCPRAHTCRCRSPRARWTSATSTPPRTCPTFSASATTRSTTSGSTAGRGGTCPGTSRTTTTSRRCRSAGRSTRGRRSGSSSTSGSASSSAWTTRRTPGRATSTAPSPACTPPSRRTSSRT
mmetsp:Transcript_167/g.566  ORF Transcript_167/g.566 Transcript_167/m.566 type:complete len:204 (-) Transcript_167:840-1451(-)